MLQYAGREQVPEVRDRRELRALFSLYTPLNSTRLMETVLADPGRVGETHEFRLPIADELNLYLMGRLVADRTLEPVGTMAVSEAGRDFEVTAESEAFADLRDTVSGLLNQAADNLARRAATARERAGNLSGEDREDALYDAEDLMAEAAAVRLDRRAGRTGWEVGVRYFRTRDSNAGRVSSGNDCNGPTRVRVPAAVRG